MFALPSALGWAAFVGLLVFAATVLRTKNTARAIVAAAVPFIFMFVWVWWALYMNNVVYAGWLGGYGYLVFGTTVSLALGAVLNSMTSPENRRSRHMRDEAPAPEGSAGGLLGTIAVLLFALNAVGWMGAHVYYTWGASNNSAFAALGNITKHDAKEAPVLPDTDPNEFIVTDVHLAYTRAHAVLGTGGNNLGSYYDVHEEEGVQQWIAGRNWIVFPMQLNSWSEYAGFFARQRDYSAGFVAVPADDPDGEVKIVDNLQLLYMTGSYFSRNAQRYVYSQGYSDGYLVDPTLEVDDNWKPYITMAYVQPAMVVDGMKVVKLLVLDPATGKIDAYAPNEAPAWVDRVNSESLVTRWAQDYGLWSVVPDFFNNNKAGQMKPDAVRIVNVHGQHQVFQIPMLANNDKASSTNGLIIYDSRKQAGDFYEGAGASGLPSYNVLKAAFESISQNTRGWHVDHIQWYRIRGVPTFMAIYAKEVTNGNTSRTVFAGVGFLSAGVTNSAEVQYGTTRDEALDKYYDYLSSRSAHNGNADETVTATEVTGQVLRIGPDPSGNGHFIVVLRGDRRVYQVPRSVNPLMPLVHDGDTVTLDFDEPAHPMDTRRSARKLVDVTLDDAMKVPAPAPAR